MMNRPDGQSIQVNLIVRYDLALNLLLALEQLVQAYLKEALLHVFVLARELESLFEVFPLYN